MNYICRVLDYMAWFWFMEWLILVFYKQNNTWTLGDMEFIFSCSHSISHSFAPLTRSISMWTLEDKFHISARPCIILYVSSSFSLRWKAVKFIRFFEVWALLISFVTNILEKTNNKETKTKTIYLVYCIPYLIFTMQCYWHLLESAMYESQILSF